MSSLHVRSPKEVRRAFRLRGETVSAWAQRNGFGKHCVYGVLSGRIKGDWGEGHRVAVALGIKPEPRRSSKVGSYLAGNSTNPSVSQLDDESFDSDPDKEGTPMR